MVIFAMFTAEIYENERELDKSKTMLLTLDGSVKDKGSIVDKN